MNNTDPQCSVCLKRFTHDGNLQAHVKAVHLGEKRQRRYRSFVCEICGKSLSSNRSYREHKNTHFLARPFECEFCPYAAASQMTLRRHKLRQHVDKTDWHYNCPYCKATFVEPTSYQNHVQHKHAGWSGTFGCSECEFKTLSSKNFVDHLGKHCRGEILDGLGRQTFIQPADIGPLNNYLIEDDLGYGGEESYEDQKSVKLSIDNNPTSSSSPGLNCQSSNSLMLKRSSTSVVINNRKVFDHGYDLVSDMQPKIVPSLKSSKCIMYPKQFPGRTLVVPEAGSHIEVASSEVVPDDTIVVDYISGEVVVDMEEEPKDLGKHVLPDGQVDFDLD